MKNPLSSGFFYCYKLRLRDVINEQETQKNNFSQ